MGINMGLVQTNCSIKNHHPQHNIVLACFAWPSQKDRDVNQTHDMRSQRCYGTRNLVRHIHAHADDDSDDDYFLVTRELCVCGCGKWAWLEQLGTTVLYYNGMCFQKIRQNSDWLNSRTNALSRIRRSALQRILQVTDICTIIQTFFIGDQFFLCCGTSCRSCDKTWFLTGWICPHFWIPADESWRCCVVFDTLSPYEVVHNPKPCTSAPP